MGDLCGGLFVMLLVLGFLAVVGHGIWALVATVVQMLFGPQTQQKPDPLSTHCVGCGRPLASWMIQCPTCGLARGSPLARRLRELYAALRQLRELQDQGVLDESLVNQVQDAFQAHKLALLAEWAPARPSLVPVSPGADAPGSPAPEPALVAVAEAFAQTAAVPLQESEPPPMVQAMLIEESAAEPEREPEPTSDPAPPLPPRRPFTELLTAFMEERNILWGEVVGGLLIVGCSVALVISLWQTLQQIPYFPFLIIATVTASIFGAGLYTLERWKLQSTSRGLLMIASLLVPLDLLVMAALHRDLGGRLDWLEIAVLGGFLGLFSYLLLRAGRVLLPEQSGLFPVAVLGTSAFEVAVPLLGTPPAVGAAMLLGSAAAVCHGGTACHLIRHCARKPEMEESDAQKLFGFLGVSTFALAVMLGLLIYASDASPAMLQGLAPLVALGGVPLLAGGALVHRRLADSAALASMRTVGTGIALAGALIQLAAIPLAWPNPLYLGLVCLLNFVVLTDAAFRWRLPIAHGAALPSLALGYLTAWHSLFGGSIDLVEWMGSATAGAALVPLVALLELLSEWLSRCERRADGRWYAIGGGVLALASLTLVSIRGIDEPMRAGVVYLLYASGILACNLRWQRPALGYVGFILAPAGTLWLLHGLAPDRLEWWAVILASEASLLAILSTVMERASLRLPSRDVGAACAILAAILSVLVPIVPGLSWTTGAWALLAGTTLLLAWSYRQAPLSWLGSVLILLAVLNGLSGAWTPATLLTALLGQATLTCLIARGVQRFGSPEADDIVAQPLDRSTLLSTFLTLPLLAMPRPDQMVLFMANAGWLAAIWLVFALERRWAWLFAGFQAALAVTVFFGVTAWLVGQPWVESAYPAALLDPRSLQAYGIGLAGLSLAWAMARPLLRQRQVIQELLEPALDRVLLAELVILQWVLAIWGVLPAVLAERSLFQQAAHWPAVEAFGPAAWMLLGLLILVLAVQLWDQLAAALAGIVLLAVTAGILASGAAGPLRAAIPTLTWSLAGCFLVGSILVWLRHPLARLADGLGISVAGEPARWIRWLLIACCIAPIVLLSLLRLLAPSAGGPMPDSFFAQIGPVLRHGLPLAVITLAFVGHALRERSVGFAFAGGLIAQLALVGGYALHLLRTQHFIDVAGGAVLLQLGTACAAVWGLGWLASRRWVDVWSEAEPGGILMTWQTGLAVFGTISLLMGGIFGVIAWQPGLGASAWTVAVGAPLGWLALALTGAVLAYRGWQRGNSLEHAWVGVLGLALVALAACTATVFSGPEWGYRALMMGTAYFALAWSLRAIPMLEPEKEAAFCVGLGYVLAVLLGLKAAFVHHDHLWAAGAIGMSACVGALMAAWQRREGWAFAAGLGLNLATSLVVWHQHLGTPFWDWWYALLQANSIASGLIALIWLAARERFLGRGIVSPRPYLASQIALAQLGNLPLVGLAFLVLFFVPDGMLLAGSQLANIGQLGGWLALLIPLSAAFWHAGQFAPERRLPLLVWHGLGCGVLAGCFALPWDTGDWFAFHVMTGFWFIVAIAVTALTLLRKEDDFLSFEDWLIEHWARLAGAFVVLLALRGSLGDPGGPFWSAGAFLGVAALAVRLGVWSARRGYAYASGLLIALAGNLVWLDRGPLTWEAFVSVNALCLALAAILWSAIALATGRKAFTGITLPFDDLATHLSLVLLVGMTATTLSADLDGQAIPHTAALAWTALVAVAVAQVLGWWKSGLAGGLYVTGLVAVGLLLHGLGLRSDQLAWSMGLALANYVLVASSIHRWGAGVIASAPLEALDGRDVRTARQDLPIWFLVTQVLVGLLAAGLSLWMSAHFGEFFERLAGPLGLMQLLMATLLLASGRSASFFRHAAFVLAGLVLVGIGWTLLGQPIHVPWLHRNIAFLTALLMTALAVTFAQASLSDPWRIVARRMATCLTLTAGVTLVVVIAQEALSYNRALDPKRTELEVWAIVAGAAACFYLIVYAIRSALAVEGVSLRVPERWRTVPVYLAELMLFFLFIHLRLSSPWLFGKWLAPYWMFLVMAVAFVGVGLSELLRRRGLLVLAEPVARTGLLLPLVPLLAFWINEPAELARPWAVQMVPGSEPMLHYLELMMRDWQKYSLVWLLTGVVYGLTAIRRRSFALALIAALSVNFSLWSLWQHADISFLVHPQFFLIPLAMIVLAAEHVNYGRLSESQALNLRYAALSLLYLSSTADMFIAGLDQVGWPLFLMLLCVAGVLAGMLLEVRAYLFLGTGFLFLVIFSMIWHTAVDRHQPWVWWASGIALGAAILGLFAVFEKRRNDVLQFVERIKAWQ